MIQRTASSPTEKENVMGRDFRLAAHSLAATVRLWSRTSFLILDSQRPRKRAHRQAHRVRNLDPWGQPVGFKSSRSHDCPGDALDERQHGRGSHGGRSRVAAVGFGGGAGRGGLAALAGTRLATALKLSPRTRTTAFGARPG
jgi:hypothetical protein